MRHHFEKEEMIEVEFDGHTRLVCPDCANHKQEHGDEAHDCKNLYVYARDADGRIATEGQCCCYSLEHGKRERC